MLCAIVCAVTNSLLNAETRGLVDLRVGLADPKVCLARFCDYETNARHDRFVSNTNFWLKGIDFSCVSPWNSASGRLRAGTAISKRHIIYASHFQIPKGARILFTDENGGVCPCRLVDSRTVLKSDIQIGLLDAELTPNIRPAMVLPEDYGKWLPNRSKWPVVTFTQHEEAVLSELLCSRIKGRPDLTICNHETDTENWKPFSRKIVVGDSGNPAFMLIGKQPVLLYCLLGGGHGFGDMIHKYRKEIQAAMDELCPGYKLQTFNFASAHANY